MSLTVDPESLAADIPVATLNTKSNYRLRSRLRITTHAVSTNSPAAAHLSPRKVFHPLSPNGRLVFGAIEAQPSAPHSTRAPPTCTPSTPLQRGHDLPADHLITDDSDHNYYRHVPHLPFDSPLSRDAELPQTQWPSDEPGTGSASYVPRTPIPIKIKTNRADLPERPGRAAHVSGWRRSARLKQKATETGRRDHDVIPHVLYVATAHGAVPAIPPTMPAPAPAELPPAVEAEPDDDNDPPFLCFVQNCVARRDSWRSQVRHLDTHFNRRFQCSKCNKTFSRPPKHNSHFVGKCGRAQTVCLRYMPYWQDRAYAYELRRPNPNNEVWRRVPQSTRQWLQQLPHVWVKQA